MTRDDVKKTLVLMEKEALDNAGRCPMCHERIGDAHLRNCLWAVKWNGLMDMLESSTPREAIPPMEGPNLLWGDPCGTYELECLGKVWRLIYRQKQNNGGALEIAIPLSEQALAEMQGMLNMIQFDFQVDIPMGAVNGRSAGHC